MLSLETRYHQTLSAYLLTSLLYSIWLQKLVLLAFYRGILHNMPWEKITMRAYLAFFLATYVVVQVITFTECNPFNHYWTILPDPGVYHNPDRLCHAEKNLKESAPRPKCNL